MAAGRKLLCLRLVSLPSPLSATSRVLPGPYGCKSVCVCVCEQVCVRCEVHVCCCQSNQSGCLQLCCSVLDSMGGAES